MRIVRKYQNVEECKMGAVVALGNFDGVHLGHQAVIREMLKISQKLDAPSSAMTFEPHPRKFFNANGPAFELTPSAAKSRQIGILGTDLHYIMPFDKKFASLSAEKFITFVLVEGLKVKHVVTGYDFVFGKGRKGKVDLLEELGKEKGFGVTVISAQNAGDGTPYSSTVIRQHLKNGRTREAATLLGRPWEIEGMVVTGDQRGRKIGFPTANLKSDGYVFPALGVYAIWVGRFIGRKMAWHPGIVNVGRRPTFGGEEITIEAHLFDFHGDLYGQNLRIAFVEYLRPEKKFGGIEEIKKQINTDCDMARDILKSLDENDIIMPQNSWLVES